MTEGEARRPRRAVVLMNLGGPDDQDAVQPFLFNLFSDPAIISVPNPLRWLIAKLISSRRAPTAREIYEQMGGGSPIVANTCAQAEALKKTLASLDPDVEWGVFIAMRYWDPLSADCAAEVKAFDPESIVLLPLYPQFSTTTTRSSLEAWQKEARAISIEAPTNTVCCYPHEQGFIDAVADLTSAALQQAGNQAVRILFSAHGLPKEVIARGDPYQWQVERTVDGILEKLGRDDLDYAVCYQSRVGPLEWIGPSTDAEIERAGVDGKGAIVVPVAFVSEHSETLVELDLEYGELAQEAGVEPYIRVPTVSAHGAFIDGLARLIRDSNEPIMSGSGRRICPSEFTACPLQGAQP